MGTKDKEGQRSNCKFQKKHRNQDRWELRCIPGI